ncbi:hypothetical protein OGAPHI_003756 [Ogataea philodendri]|uniref:Uncharacterized protein n=1 Tax=Ogataea philodendri TaxID=1378263 RepID=A0A9P8T4S9_9ASCO|nr:uncharacterized protein OGAPHI_003756 [Ogataea philodendri]KAH3665569.1 hypothetical protein OGAPHI_003756 [Ogataea philodendri]
MTVDCLDFLSSGFFTYFDNSSTMTASRSSRVSADASSLCKISNLSEFHRVIQYSSTVWVGYSFMHWLIVKRTSSFTVGDVADSFSNRFGKASLAYTSLALKQFLKACLSWSGVILYGSFSGALNEIGK